MKPSAVFAATICLIGMTAGHRATATPADPLLPILDDIRAQLPPGMVMRLPTQAAVDGVQDALYASVETNEGEVRIDFGSAQGCSARGPRACMRGYFSSTPAGIEHPRTAYAREFEIGRAPITLADGVVGHYITVEGENTVYGVRGPHSIVLWEQDEQTYVVSIAPKYQPPLAGLTPQESARQRILDFAIAMATEPPLVKE